jgi:hypothetical protein
MGYSTIVRPPGVGAVHRAIAVSSWVAGVIA